MAPTLIYDKSAIQSFSAEEATWLDNLFFINLPPTLFMEVLADFKKHPSDHCRSLNKVKALADKVSPIHTYHNIHHRTMWRHNLLGDLIPMGMGKTLVSPGTPIDADNGERGMLMEETPEEKALTRWRMDDFNEFEQGLAERWRESISEIDLIKYVQAYSQQRPKHSKRINDCEELARVVKLMCDGRSGPYRLLKSIVASLEPNDSALLKKVIKRWKVLGRPSIESFAPYAMYCYQINIFFAVGLVDGLLSTRATNMIDLQYLYYLPFCTAFTSGDKFHKMIVPLFLNENQMFVDAVELKKDLKLISDEWNTSERKGGTMNFIDAPLVGKGMVSEKIWDMRYPDWKERANQPRVESTQEEKDRLMDSLQPALDAIKKHTENRGDEPTSDWDAKLNPKKDSK